MRNALLQDHPVIVSLGRMGVDGDAHDVFGLEIDVALDGESRIHVLDRRNHVVKMFGRDGGYLGSFGRAGQGPEEFRDPGALEAMSDGRLVVSDRGNRVKVFSPSADGYVHSATHRLELVPEKACSAADRLFVSGWDAGSETMIHEVPVSEERGRAQSFGNGYTSGSWIVQDGISDGPIACFADPLRVVFAFEQIPIVAAYSVEDQAPLWEAKLDGFMQPPLTEMPSGGLAFSARVLRDIVVSLAPGLAPSPAPSNSAISSKGEGDVPPDPKLLGGHGYRGGSVDINLVATRCGRRTGALLGRMVRAVPAARTADVESSLLEHEPGGSLICQTKHNGARGEARKEAKWVWRD